LQGVNKSGKLSCTIDVVYALNFVDNIPRAVLVLLDMHMRNLPYSLATRVTEHSHSSVLR